MARKKRVSGIPAEAPTPPPPPKDIRRSKYCVAAYWRDEGYGGVTEFDSEAEALAHGERMRGPLGYEIVHVWKMTYRRKYLSH
jgi:hypothetical protein